jgi:hypothetical protein
MLAWSLFYILRVRAISGVFQAIYTTSWRGRCGFGIEGKCSLREASAFVCEETEHEELELGKSSSAA